MKCNRLFILCFLLIIQYSAGNCDEDYPPYLTIIGNVEMADGIGRHAADLIKSFKNELSIGFVHTRDPIFKDVPKEIIPILRGKKKLGKVLLLEDLIWCAQTKTYELILPEKREDQLLLAYSVFESDQIPQEWVLRLNTHFDAVAVGDPFLVDVYQRSGVTIPVFALPLGLHLEDFLCQPLKTAKNNEVFTFGALGYAVDRKNLVKLIQGFSAVFKNNPHVKLRINCRGAHQAVRERIEHEIHHLGIQNVEFTVNSLSQYTYLNLFKSLDCFISVSKGEGFSIQPREAMALGIPVIITNNSAQTTICNSGLVREIPSRTPIPALYHWLGRTCGHFCDCEVNDIAEALKDVYDNYKSYLNKGQQIRDWARKYHYPNLIPFYRGFIKPKIIELGEVNRLEPNKMITNSRKFYEKYLTILLQNDENR